MSALDQRRVGLRLGCAAILVLSSLGGCGSDDAPVVPAGFGHGVPIPDGSGGTGAPSTGGTGGTIPGGTGGTIPGGTGGTIGATALSLVEYVGPEIWTRLRQTITVDSNDVIYVTDGVQVYAIADGVPSVYVSRAQLGEVVDEQFLDILSLDVGPDDRLYLHNDGRPAEILVSEEEGDISVHLTEIHLGVGGPLLIGVDSADRILGMVSQGMAAITAEGGTMLYAKEQVQGGTDCGAEDFVVTGSVFYYLPGCTGNDLISGSTDGSAAGLFIDEATLQEYFEFLGAENTTVWGFSGIGAHPAGGLMVNFSRALVRVAADGSFSHISTNPPLYDKDRDVGDDMDFLNSPLAVGSRGQVYLINYKRTKIYLVDE